MSIPLGRLYHYISTIAQEICNEGILIYRFFPHGSKNINDLTLLDHCEPLHRNTLPEIYCHDQEPLNYDLYNNDYSNTAQALIDTEPAMLEFIQTHNIQVKKNNLRIYFWNIFDSAVLLHSEKRSSEVTKYQQNNFITAYFWSHALIALDWYRYGQHIKIQKQVKKTFLIYNRAWTGTREYRLKFVDLLIDNDLVEYCQTSVSFNDNDIYYQKYTFNNLSWRPKNHLENHYNENTTTSCYSADFDINDYNATDIEVVLETLFDDYRLHLTEKALRPIALGQPFILVATHGSLEYLRSYGFKTFDSVIDESYDTIEDPVMRMNAIIKLMKQISQWSESERTTKMLQLEEIANYNKTWFYNNDFLKLITTELKNNLNEAIVTLINTNTSTECIKLRKQLKDCELYNLTHMSADRKQRRIELLKIARKYYNKYLHAQKNIN